jgi:alkanesulfonate monooxygenase SsuD/methylene tetrahydromethanopterin reductase-like flavin-dependent oxidoreductase (luciferase family)
MDVGIGLPNAVLGVDRSGIVDWARRAEAAGFSSLGTIDRIAFPNYESLVSLAAAAAVTERIRLMTDVLLAPLHANTALLAKQTATIDAISGGRFVLGAGVGGREDDYTTSGLDFHTRGKAFDRQLEDLARFWGGDLGPAPASGKRPGLMIGGGADVTFERAAKWADGWTQGGGTPEAHAEGREKTIAAWRAAGREGTPRTVALAYYALGDNAQAEAEKGLGAYYAWLGEYTQSVIDAAAKDADSVKGYRDAFAATGCDELILFPASPDPAQVELLAEALA